MSEVLKRQHYHPGECFEGSHLCKLEDESERHRDYWRSLREGTAHKKTLPLDSDPTDCFHRAPWSGKVAECGTCGNGRRIKVYTCNLFDVETTIMSPALEGFATCSGCVKRSLEDPSTQRVNLGAGGLGDTLMAIGVMTAYARSTSGPTSLGINPFWADFAVLFALPFRLHPHIHDQNSHANPDRTQRQMNAGYQLEMLMLGARSGIPRWERYARNIGSTGFARPELRDVAGHQERGKRWKGSIVLAPFSTHTHRDWRVENWQTLERLLRDRGYRTVIFHRELPPELRVNKDVAALELLRSERAVDLDARSAVDLFVNVDCIVSNDSGPAHLAGLIGRPAIVLCGQVRGSDVYSCYPSVRPLDGSLDCAGCYWNEPNVGGQYNPQRCLPCCANLQSITPRQVADLVDEMVLPFAIAQHRSLLCGHRLITLRNECRRAIARPGQLAEAGSFNGGSALLLSHFHRSAELHLFDALGLPEDDCHPFGRHRRGEFAGKQAEIEALPWTSKVHFHWGRLPQTFAGLEGLRFSMVHLDLDTLQATRDALEWFWPRLVRGGVIVLDDVDWHHCPGVRQALNEVLPDVPVEKPHQVQGVIRKA